VGKCRCVQDKRDKVPSNDLWNVFEVFFSLES